MDLGEWTMVAVLTILTLLGLYVAICQLVIWASWALRRDEVRHHLEEILLNKPGDVVIDAVARVFTWPKRQVDRRHFAREFGFKPKGWPSGEEVGIIDQKLASAANVLFAACLGEERLREVYSRHHGHPGVSRHHGGPVRETELQEAARAIAKTKKWFWGLHDLAARVAKYPDCYNCSYKQHTSSATADHRRAPNR